MRTKIVIYSEPASNHGKSEKNCALMKQVNGISCTPCRKKEKKKGARNSIYNPIGLNNKLIYEPVRSN